MGVHGRAKLAKLNVYFYDRCVLGGSGRVAQTVSMELISLDAGRCEDAAETGARRREKER